jgi:hypothetical protein
MCQTGFCTTACCVMSRHLRCDTDLAALTHSSRRFRRMSSFGVSVIAVALRDEAYLSLVIDAYPPFTLE